MELQNEMKKEINVGRAVESKDGIHVPEIFTMVGNFHAKLVYSAMGILLCDNDSKNHTYVNGIPISKKELSNTDSIFLGDPANGFPISPTTIFNDYYRWYKENKVDFSEEFKEKWKIFKEFETEKNKLENRNWVINIIFLALGPLIFLINEIAEQEIPLVNYSPILSSSFFIRMYVFKSPDKLKNKILNLTLKYEDQWICPKCKKNIPFRDEVIKRLLLKKECPHNNCKATYPNGFC